MTKKWINDANVKFFFEELFDKYPEVLQKISKINCLLYIKTKNPNCLPTKENFEGNSGFTIPFFWGKSFKEILEARLNDRKMLETILPGKWYFLSSRTKTIDSDACFFCTRTFTPPKRPGDKKLNVWTFFICSGGLLYQQEDIFAQLWSNESYMCRKYNSKMFFIRKLLKKNRKISNSSRV